MAGMYESIPASPEEVEAFASELKPSHLRCRTWGHDPLPYDYRRVEAETVTRDGHQYVSYAEVLARCTHRCGVLWVILVDENLRQLKRSLDYTKAPGYLHEGGRIAADGKTVFRREFMTRVFTPKEKG